MAGTPKARKGVDEIHTEQLSTKLCILCLTLMAMGISSAFCVLYW